MVAWQETAKEWAEGRDYTVSWGGKVELFREKISRVGIQGILSAETGHFTLYGEGTVQPLGKL